MAAVAGALLSLAPSPALNSSRGYRTPMCVSSTPYVLRMSTSSWRVCRFGRVGG